MLGINYSKKWYHVNREKILAQRKKRYQSNRQRELAQAKKYRDANRERCLASSKKWRNSNHEKRLIWYRKNREKSLAQNKKWREDNREKYLTNLKKWREANRERKRLSDKKWCDDNLQYRLVQKRIRREKIKGISPIGQILNERFDGSELHHTGILELETEKFYGVYIPKSLNRNHCAQIGKERNLDRVNFDAIEFLVRGLD